MPNAGAEEMEDHADQVVETVPDATGNTEPAATASAPTTQLEEAVTLATSKDNTPTVIYQDSFDYTCWNNTFFTTDGIWSKEFPQFGNNSSFNSVTPVVEDGVMKLTEGMSAQFNWTRLSETFSFNSDNTYTLTFDVTVKDFGDDQPLTSNAFWKREFYFAAAGWYNQIEFQSDHAVGCIRTGNLPEDQSSEARAGTKDVDYLLNTTYSAEMIWEPSTGTVTTTVRQGDTVISTGSRTNTTDYTHADSYCSNWVFRCEDGEVWVDNIRFTDGTNRYTQSFDNSDPASGMAFSGIWKLETFRVEPDAKAPNLAEGVVKLTSGTSILFDWYTLMGRTYDPGKAYTFAFDFKLNHEGSGATWVSSRALYVGSGGWYNHIELLGESQPYASVRAGDSYTPYEQSVYLNQTIHAELVWKGNTITTTLYDAGDNLLLTGSRTKSDFTSMTAENGAMTSLVLRCEDGAVEIDNFTFSIGGADEKTPELQDTTQLEIAEDQQGVYVCNINYTAGDHPSLLLGDGELFSLKDGSLRLFGSQVTGRYPEGTYRLQITINPAQKMLDVDLTLPNGGTVRRGAFDQIKGSRYTMNLYGYEQETFSDISVSYQDITTRSYTLNSTEPVYTGFKANVYNLVSSFDDARTTRNFAWTALRSYIGTDSMAVRYRLSGTEDWTTVEAQVETGSFINATEVYLKADVTGLDADSTYQYQIGKPNSTKSSDWSEIYTFTTAPERVSTFSFVAVGDTQGNSWADYRPLMLAQAAYAEALEATPNAAFILHTGDIVESGEHANLWNRFFKALGNYGATIPHFAAIGNHDALQVSSEFYFDLHFNHPNNGGSSSLDTAYTSRLPSGSNLAALAKRADETFYSFNYGDAHFIVLNSGAYTAADQYLLEAQRAWLISDLQDNAHAKWTIVLVHEPVYHRRGGTESRPWLYDVIEGYGVDLVIQGHSHLVTRSYPMKIGAIVTKKNPDTITRGSGTVYTTIGSTTTNHDSMGNPNMEEMMLIRTPASEQAAYTSVTVTDTRLTMTVRQLDGLVLDQFTITGPVPDKGHSYTDVVTEPTCTEQGYTVHTCRICDKTYVDAYVDPLGHLWDEGRVSHEPTEETEGIMTYTCSRCDAVREDSIPVLEHVHRYSSVISAPSCVEQGYTTYICNGCGDTYIADEIPALGHTEVIDEAVASTCSVTGLTEGKHCSVCEEILVAQEVIPALGHSFTEQEGKILCGNCSEELSIRIAQEHLLLNTGDALELDVSPAEFADKIEWSIEGDEGIITTECNVVTAVAAGTARVKATIAAGEFESTVRFRVDVIGEQAIEGVQLSTTKATAELYKTDYTTFDILLKLPQNYSAQANADRKPVNNGVAIESAKFTDETMAKYFSLAVLDDRTVQIVPTAVALENAKTVKSSYKGTVTVTVDGEPYETEMLTLSVKKTLPKLKATVAAFNSFYAFQSQPIVITGATVTGIKLDPDKALPEWLTLKDGCLVLNEKAPAKSISGKVNLLVETAEWAVPAALTLTVKNTYKVPGVKLAATSVTVSNQPGPASVELKLVPTNKADTLSGIGISGITAPEGYTVENFNAETGTFTLKTADGFKAGKIELTVNCGTVTNTLKLTIKTQAVKLKLSASKVSLNKNLGDVATVTVNCLTAGFDVTAPVLTYDAEMLDVQYADGKLTVSAKDAAYGKTYPVTVSAYQGGPAVKLNVAILKQNVAVKSTIKATGFIDVIRDSSVITVTPTYTNVLNVDVDNAAVLKIYSSTDKFKTAIAEVKAEDGIFTVDKSVISDQTLKYKAQLETAIGGNTIKSNLISLTVKMGTAKLTVKSSDTTLFAKDCNDRAMFWFESADASLNDIARVEFKNAKQANMFDLIDYGNGAWAIGFKDGKVDKSLIGKTVTVALNVFIEGNQTAKANATANVKLTIVR